MKTQEFWVLLFALRLDKGEPDLLPVCDLLGCGVQKHLLLPLVLNGLILFYVQMSHCTFARCVGLEAVWGSVHWPIDLACSCRLLGIQN